VVLTARDAFQVCELADKKGIQYVKIGRHFGKNPVKKVIGLLWRSAQLVPFYLLQRPRLALSLGARSQILFCRIILIPTISITDYEHTRETLAQPRWLVVAEALFNEQLSTKAARIRSFRGIKENVYAPEFKPDFSLIEELGIGQDGMVVTVRPPANEAHYYHPDSDVLFFELMSRICQTPGIRAVLLPRNDHQEQCLRAHHPDWFLDGKTIVPSGAVDGLNLIWLSDFVVGGGGTMNREAAALGVPAYSIFRGKTGAVDRMLEREGRLTMIRSAEEVWTKIAFVRRDKTHPPDHHPREALHDIVNHIEDIIRIERVSSSSRGKAGRS